MGDDTLDDPDECDLEKDNDGGLLGLGTEGVHLRLWACKSIALSSLAQPCTPSSHGQSLQNANPLFCSDILLDR